MKQPFRRIRVTRPGHRELRNPCGTCGKNESISEHTLKCWACLDEAVNRASANFVDIDRVHPEMVPDAMRKHKGKGMIVRRGWGSYYTGSDR